MYKAALFFSSLPLLYTTEFRPFLLCIISYQKKKSLLPVKIILFPLVLIHLIVHKIRGEDAQTVDIIIKVGNNLHCIDII